ncbi:Alpha-methylacyl-CoA racemase, partial [Armadillidium vulgare]
FHCINFSHYCFKKNQYHIWEIFESSAMLLKNIKVLEFAGLAPGPFCGKILSDYGAQVVKIDRPNFTNYLA